MIASKKCIKAKNWWTRARIIKKAHPTSQPIWYFPLWRALTKQQRKKQVLYILVQMESRLPQTDTNQASLATHSTHVYSHMSNMQLWKIRIQREISLHSWETKKSQPNLWQKKGGRFDRGKFFRWLAFLNATSKLIYSDAFNFCLVYFTWKQDRSFILNFFEKTAARVWNPPSKMITNTLAWKQLQTGKVVMPMREGEKAWECKTFVSEILLRKFADFFEKSLRFACAVMWSRWFLRFPFPNNISFLFWFLCTLV